MLLLKFIEESVEEMKKLYLCILILWMGVIFVFSNQNAEVSENVSDGFTSKVVDTVASVKKDESIKENKKEIIEDSRFFIRKTAHFSLYLVLGILIYLNVKDVKKINPIIISLMFCILYACSDEIHQMFINERTAKVLDILIDTTGSLTGILLIYLFSSKKRKKVL